MIAGCQESGCNLRAMQLVDDQLLSARPDRRVIQRAARVQPHVSWTLKEVKVAQCLVLFGDHSNLLEVCPHRSRRHRHRERIDHAHPRLRRALRQFLSRAHNRLLDRYRSQRHLRRIDHRAGHGQHQCCRVTKVAVELDGPRAHRQLELIQLQVDVREFLLLVFDVVGELDIDHRCSRETERPDAEIRGRVGLQVRTHRHDLLDGPCNQLLDLFRRRARPWTLRRSHAHRNIRVFPLRHVVIAEESPHERCQ